MMSCSGVMPRNVSVDLVDHAIDVFEGQHARGNAPPLLMSLVRSDQQQAGRQRGHFGRSRARAGEGIAAVGHVDRPREPAFLTLHVACVALSARQIRHRRGEKRIGAYC